MKLELSKYQVRLLRNHLSSLTDAGAETLDKKEMDAIDDIIFKLNKSDGGIVKDGE